MKSKSICTTILSLFILSSCQTKFKNMNNQNTDSLYPKGEQLSKEWFSGNAFLKPLVAKDHNNEFSAGSVTFEAGARTHWHTHPKGQVLLVTEGNGFYQERNKKAQPIAKGDVINIPENVEHWHGATATTKMVHIAITNFKEDSQVTWLEAVSDEEYQLVNNQN